ncbi:MAG TPA: ACP phosphodiesterase [Gemmata sp.]|nr:ACP phosphodiesterase [Gemmata sp.]
MNFLAHLHLADPEPELMLGGIVADFARNPEIAARPEGIQRGVHLHRLIDGFTDRHAIVQRSISRVSARLGWFAGITIDIYYDHILAREWARYSTEPLRDFADRANDVLNELFPLAPVDSQGFLRRFIDQDQLFGYATSEGISATLARVSRQIAERIPKRAIWLPDALPHLHARDVDLAADFHAFYPELMAFVQEHRGSVRKLTAEHEPADALRYP